MARNKRADKKEFLETLTETPFITHASRRIGLPRATVYKWMKEDTKFDNDVKAATESGFKYYTDIAESKLMTLIQNGNLNAIKFYLTHRHPTYIGDPVSPEDLRIRARPVTLIPFDTDKDGKPLPSKSVLWLDKNDRPMH